MKKVLFVCVHNSGRSQMAEAFFNRFAKGKAQAGSAGTSPASEINAVVVKVMLEEGIDISKNKPGMLTMDMLKSAGRVITMGCGAEKACPAAFVPTEDWGLEDPEGKTIQEIREIRDVIKDKVKGLIQTL
jgi:arsenate reductase (thioredoxin)